MAQPGVRLLVHVALGQTRGYDLRWNLAGASRGTMSAGAYALKGSAGQADAGTMSGGGYMLKVASGTAHLNMGIESTCP